MKTYLEKFIYTLNGIFKYYYNSTVRRNERKLIADMFEEEVAKLGLEGYDNYFSKHCLDKIVSGTSDYLPMRYNAFNKTSLKEMVQLFDFKHWSKSFKESNWGIDAINVLTGYYETDNWITKEETAAALQQRIPFRNKISKFRNDKLIDAFSDMLIESDDGFNGMHVLLQIMTTFSASTAACECRFSCMNKQKPLFEALFHTLPSMIS